MKKFKFKEITVMKSTSKTRFNHYFLSNILMISFEDLTFKFYI